MPMSNDDSSNTITGTPKSPPKALSGTPGTCPHLPRDHAGGKKQISPVTSVYMLPGNVPRWSVVLTSNYLTSWPNKTLDTAMLHYNQCCQMQKYPLFS
ncbi:hypothetical protein E2C01_063373 [Portunus trituberculatus]|uniref:Uncharacterized protein n=1 Tax=Portunus trituberculatus TaxID=210409 RepID=A0A5B7HK98_PORTR|nr:hypothetical protein [Portunus trituberculatus]